MKLPLANWHVKHFRWHEDLTDQYFSTIIDISLKFRVSSNHQIPFITALKSWSILSQCFILENVTF